MADIGRTDPLRDIRNERLAQRLMGERVRINFLSAATPVVLRIHLVGMDFVGGTKDDDARIIVPLTAIAFVEFPP